MLRSLNDVDEMEPLAANDQPSVPIIRATPYAWRDPSTIPPRPWIYGRWLLRGTIACVVAPGGAGKSTVLAGTALALVTGRELLGKTAWGGPQRVWIWNLEDDGDELARAIQAAALYHDIAPTDLDGRLFVDSGMEGAGLCTAIEGNDGFKLLAPVYDALAEEIRRQRIDVLMIDPFVSSHKVDENHNSKIDAIAKAWARAAKDSNCAIVLVHHTSKAGAGEVTALSSRGAVSLINAARCTLTINRMATEDAERLGIDDKDRRRTICVVDDKHNRAPAEAADWYRLEGVDLENHTAVLPSDNIAVAVRWTLPDPFDDVKTGDLYAIQLAISEGEWRKDPQAAAWAGKAVADVLGWDASDKAMKGKIKSLLHTWISNHALRIETRNDKKREPREWIIVGEWAQPAQPLQGGARQGAAN